MSLTRSVYEGHGTHDGISHFVVRKGGIGCSIIKTSHYFVIRARANDGDRFVLWATTSYFQLLWFQFMGPWIWAIGILEWLMPTRKVVLQTSFGEARVFVGGCWSFVGWSRLGV